MFLSIIRHILLVFYATGMAVSRFFANFVEIWCETSNSGNNNYNNYRRSTAFNSTMLPIGVAATSTAANMPVFRSEEDNWHIWRQLLESHFNELAVFEDEKRVAILLKNIGLSAYGTLIELCDPIQPASKSYEQLCDILERQYSRPTIVFRERQNFFRATKKEAETVALWFARLKKLAKKCRFGPNLDTFVLNQFVTGCSGKLFEKLCEEDERLTLDDAFKKAMIFEAKNCSQQQQQRANMATGSGEHVQFVSKKRGKRRGGNQQKKSNNNIETDGINSNHNNGSQSSRCSHCGFAHAEKDCKFKAAVCRICKKKGHIQRVCRNQVNLVNQETQLSANEHNATQYSGVDSTTDFVSNFSIFSVSDEAASIPFVVSVLVQRVPVKFVLDSGAAVSLLSMKDFEKFFGQTSLKPCHEQYRAYNGQAIKLCGEFYAQVQFKEQIRELRFIVSDTNSPPILGRDFMKAFNIGLSVLAVENSVQSLNDVVANIKSKFANVFQDGLGKFNARTVKLELKDGAKPVFCKPRHVPLALREPIDKELKRLIDCGVLVQVDHAEWATPLVPVLKPDGSVRICGDYKTTVNPFLVDIIYPLPRIDEIFARLKGTLFSKLDLSNAYTQLVLDDESQMLCAWSTHLGIFKMTRLPFGVKPAAAIFQKTIENLLRDIPNVINYLDDIVITGSNLEEHVKTLELLLSRLQSVGLRLNVKKCCFFQERISYLGFSIDKDGLSKNKDKVAAVLEAPVPKDVSEVRAFVGIVNYYSKFIRSFAHLMEPLYALLRKDVKFMWSDKCQRAYQALKEAVTSDQVLVHYDPKLPIVLSTDASNVAVAGILSHEFENGEVKPIAFVSRALSSAERNYSTIQKEALAIVYSVVKLRQYLLGNRFTLFTDHKPLLAIFGEKKGLPVMAAARMQRWALILSGFNYTVRYIKGELNYADHLSRLPQHETVISEDECNYVNFVEDNNQLNLQFQAIARETKRDPILAKVVEAINKGSVGTLSGDEFSAFRNKKNELSVEYDCILWGYRTVIPLKLRESVLSELHRSHLGIVKTKALARSYVWWPNIDRSIEETIANCLTCKLSQPSPERALLSPWQPTAGPWSRIHIDFAGPIQGNHFLLIVDSYSKWIEVYRTKNATTNFTINCLRDTFCRFGLIDTLVSDNGRQFTSDEFKQFTERNGIKHILNAPGHPSTNGQAEVYVKTFKKSLFAALASTKAEVLDLHIQRFLFDYRCAKHTTTGESPAKLLIGRELKSRFSLMKPPLVQNRIRESQQTTIENHHGSRNVEFEVGESVFVRDYTNPNKKAWQKATVASRIGSQMYNCILTRNKKPIMRHLDQMSSGLPKDNQNLASKTDQVQESETSSPPSLAPGTSTDASGSDGGALSDTLEEESTDSDT